MTQGGFRLQIPAGPVLSPVPPDHVHEQAVRKRAGKRQAIPVRGWAAEILARQERGGWWVGGENLYRPKYLSSNWMLLILADLGLTRREPGIRKACELWLERWQTGYLPVYTVWAWVVVVVFPPLFGFR